jgi:hypothetical protein
MSNQRPYRTIQNHPTVKKNAYIAAYNAAKDVYESSCKNSHAPSCASSMSGTFAMRDAGGKTRNKTNSSVKKTK